MRWYFAANTNTTPQTEKPQKEGGKNQFCVVCRFYVKDEVRLDNISDIFLLVSCYCTLPTAEVLSGKNVRAFLVNGFLMKSFHKNILKI